MDSQPRSSSAGYPPNPVGGPSAPGTQAALAGATAPATPAALPVPAVSTLSPDHVAEAFPESLKRRGVSPFYQLGLLVVAIAMVLLPLVYVSIIGAVGYGVFLHATENTEILDMETSSAKGKAGAFLVYLAPIVAGAILLLFMVKPLFARRAVVIHSVPLEREKEPTFFAFVESLCQTVRAPVPKRIEVNCEVNASASFGGGLGGLFGKNLVLTVGLPLVSGLTLRQLTGVLAHEFGHFSQGAAMRLSYVIRAINNWFARVVYERDVWDARLAAWSKSIDIRVGFILYLTRFFVWLTRKILWVLMILGHAISCFMMRQMEYDADTYEARVAGSDTFGETSRRMRQLAVAYNAVHYDLEESWKERRLGDDFATMVSERVQELPADILKKVEEQQQKARTGIFDTHPSDRARIRRAQKLNQAGVLQIDGPALSLFASYPEAARIASMFYYTELLGPMVRPENLTSTQLLVQQRRQQEQEMKGLGDYLGQVFNSAYPLEFPEAPLRAPDNPQEPVRSLREAYLAMFQVSLDAHAAAQEYREAYANLINARRAKALLDAGFRIDAKSFNLAAGTRETAEAAERDAESRMMRLRSRLDPFAEVTRNRLLSALQLLLLPQAQQRLAGKVPDPQEIRKLHECLLRISWGISFVKDLQRDLLTLNVLFANYQGNEEQEGLLTRIHRGISKCHQQLKTIYASYQSEAYPFDHSQGRISVAQYLMGTLPTNERDPAVLPKCQETLDNFYSLYPRILGRLCMAARTLESAMGYPDKPLPKPEPEKEEDKDEG